MIQNLFANNAFNDQIDTPLVSKKFLDSKEANDLEVLMMPLYGEEMQVKGVFRVYSAKKITEDIQSSVEDVAQRIGLFFERIQNLRGHLGQMQMDLDDKNERLEIHNLESSVHHCLFEILASI